MNINDVYILEERAILYVSGDDSEAFLQNLVSNDVKKVSEDRSCFASLFTPQGKYLYEFIIVKHKKGYFLECEKKIANDLYSKLNLYKLRSKVEILNLSNEFVIAVLSKPKFLSLSNAKEKLGYTIKFREDPIYLDPRHIDLGARLIINLEKLYLSIKKLGLEVSNTNEYYNYSHELGIAQIDTNNLQNKLFGIECNFEELNGIDFRKGCYVGQENTARIKLKDKLNKRLFAVKVQEGEITSDEITSNNKNIGKLLINNENPFALLKLENKKFNFDADLNCGDAKIKALKPNWL